MSILAFRQPFFPSFFSILTNDDSYEEKKDDAWIDITDKKGHSNLS